MKITFVLPSLSMVGGVRVVAIYAEKLKQLGHDVFIVAQPPRPVKFITKVKAFLKRKPIPKTIKRPSYIDNLDVPQKVLTSFRPIRNRDVPDADIVIATWWETAEWVNQLNTNKGAKVYFLQHYEVFDYLPVERCHATYRMPLHKIAIAKWIKDVVQKNYGDTQIDLVPNSVDKAQFFALNRHKQPHPTVGFLYSPTGFKGIDTTLDVIARLKQQFSNLRVVCFGNTKPNNHYANWDDSIEFIYLPPQDTIRDIYAACDVWLTASRSEGFNLPAMEAMSCHTPVVSTREGWPAEAIIDGYNGYLCQVDDVDALTNATAKILALSDADWLTMSQNAHKTVEDSSWDHSAQLFEQSLYRAIERKKNGEIG